MSHTPLHHASPPLRSTSPLHLLSSRLHLLSTSSRLVSASPLLHHSFFPSHPPRRIVHRGAQGANLILSEKDKKFKFIDFGVACDLVTGRNYNKDLQPFDPSYCPPEAPPIDKQGDGGLQLSAGGAFDVFSAGLLVVQMCFPNTRSDQGIKRFKMALDGCGYDLKEWRESLEGVRGYEEGFELLDAHGGWSLLQGCLKRQPSQRISAAAAASSGFCRV